MTPLSRLPDDTIGEALSYLADNLRETDLNEIWAQLGVGPEVALPASVEASSKAWLITDQTGLPIALFGVAPTALPDVGAPWLVGTPGVDADSLSFARKTRHYVGVVQRDYRVLTNFVDARNETAIDWLLFAGFNLIDADPRHGPEERLFFQFSRTQ